MDYKKDINELFKELDSRKNGLSREEVKARTEKDGLNTLPKKKRPGIFKLYIKELLSPMEIILIVTIILSFITKEITDACVITFILLVDTIMGTYQENKALKSAESLQGMLKSKSKVLRDGKEFIVNSEYIVKGDILLLESGNRINADARIIECKNLQVDESVLTGESTTVSKDNEVIGEDRILAERSNMLYAGSCIVSGRASAIVTSTGIDTELGNIAKQVIDTEEEKSPLTIRMERFTKQIGIFIVFVALISSGVLISKGYELSAVFLSVIALAISAMPEGLPLALTMALSIASNRMSKKHVIVKNLSSVEALGSCTVIASDKTGTLTVNEQTARKIVLKDGSEIEVLGSGYNDKGEILETDDTKERVSRIVNLCALNNEAYIKEKKNSFETYGDSIDLAFLFLQAKYHDKKTYKKEVMISYESEKQYSAVFYKDEGKLRCTVKGSLEKIMEFSENKDEYKKQNESLSEQGFRVIAVCDGEVQSTNEKDIKNLEFLGMVAFIDPERKEVKDSILECKNAGIKVIMITGDHPITALSIGKDLEIASYKNEVTTGKELEKFYKKGEEAFDEFIKDKKIFSRVTPTDKLRIVESLKRQGEFVAVTGDGVNDAPAIKSANIGVAMGRGTDVAQDTADMIIMDDNFTSIVEGIKEGRIAYANIRKIILFLISCGLAEVLFYLLAVGFGYPLPLLAIQLLWLNIVTDGLQDMALSFEGSSKDIMNVPPRDTKESIFSKDLIIEVLLFGTTMAINIFLLWKILNDRNTNLLLSRSIIMFVMVFLQNIHVLNCRSEKCSIFKTPILSNPFILITIIGSILLQILVVKVPMLANILKITDLSIEIILGCLLLSTSIILVSETYKVLYRHFSKKD